MMQVDMFQYMKPLYHKKDGFIRQRREEASGDVKNCDNTAGYGSSADIHRDLYLAMTLQYVILLSNSLL